MKFKIHVWRQSSRSDSGKMASYEIDDISPDASFLEMMDLLNEKLITSGEEPVAFDHDCREGVCGCLLYTSPSPRDATLSRMPSSA